jgi:hypothetical protein
MNRRCHGINENPEQGLITGVIVTGDKNKAGYISANFRKNSKWPVRILKGQGETDT